MIRVGKRVALVAWLLVLVVISGCSNRAIKAYDGDELTEAQLGMLQAPEDIRVKFINDKKMKSFLMDNLALNYSLKPGQNKVRFHYESLWATPNKKDEFKHAVEEVSSDMMEVLINVQPGETYTFELDRPANRSEAKAMVPNLTVTLVSSSGARMVAHRYVETQPSAIAAGGGTNGGQAAEVAVAPSIATPVTLPAAMPGGDLSNVEALKVIWKTATPEEKKAFLKWAFK